MTPTEPGWYWVKGIRDVWSLVKIHVVDGELVFRATAASLIMDIQIHMLPVEWGPRIEPPEGEET